MIPKTKIQMQIKTGFLKNYNDYLKFKLMMVMALDSL